MIHKSVPNPRQSATKRERVQALLEYIAAPDDMSKCLEFGGRNFLCKDLAGCIAELVASVEGAARSRDPVHHCVFSWPEDERPTAAQAEEAVEIYLRHIGFEQHLCAWALHDDTANRHLHIVLDRVDPETGRVRKVNRGFHKLAGAQAVALIEAAQGWRPEEGAVFSVLEDGTLARSHGSRQFGDRPPPVPDHVRDEAERKGEPSAVERAQEAVGETFGTAASWQEIHDALRPQGLRFERKGSGAVIHDGEVELKASSVSRVASMAKLRKRLGEFEPDTLSPAPVPAVAPPEPSPAPAPPPAPAVEPGDLRPVLFERYHEAVQADRYRVTAIRETGEGQRQAFVLDRQQGESHGFSPDELRVRIGELVRLDDRRGENIYLTPLSADLHHLVVDDLTLEQLERMDREGFQPSAVLESSPGNFQSVFSVPRVAADDLDRWAANAVVCRLNQAYGDPKSTGAVRPHRAPGFTNRKPQHRRTGRFPRVRLVRVIGGFCSRVSGLLRDAYEELVAARLPSPRPAPRTTVERAVDGRDLAIYRAHREALQELIRHAPDWSRIDAMVAERLRACGLDCDAIAACIEAGVLAHSERTAKQDHAQDYARRTAEFAWTADADHRIRRLRPWHEDWQRLTKRAEVAWRRRQGEPNAPPGDQPKTPCAPAHGPSF